MNWTPMLFTPEGGPCMWSCEDITYHIVGGDDMFRAQAHQAVFLAASLMHRNIFESDAGRITIYAEWPFDGVAWPGWTRCRLDATHRYYRTCQSYINPYWYGLMEGTGQGRGLIEHELGHALGMGHNTDATSVMNPDRDEVRVADYGPVDQEGLVWLGNHC